MATQKPKIQGYIEQAIYDRFEAYRQESSLSQSQALEKILASFFGSEQQSDLSDRFESLCQYIEQEFKKLQERVATLEITSDLPTDLLEITTEQVIGESLEITSDLPTSSDRMVVCKFYKNAAKDPQSWQYWAGPKNGFVESLDKANTYTLRGAERVINQLLDDVMHKPSTRERISYKPLEELKVYASEPPVVV